MPSQAPPSFQAQIQGMPEQIYLTLNRPRREPWLRLQSPVEPFHAIVFQYNQPFSNSQIRKENLEKRKEFFYFLISISCFLFFYTSLLPSIALPSVAPSIYSISLPTGIPVAILVIFIPIGFKSLVI